MEVIYNFVNYGENLQPQPDTVVLDVGMKTIPGVIDHHHPGAEAECAASLVVKSPHLVLDHIRELPPSLHLITHRLPDFDALASIFLALRLLQTKRVDSSMEKIARYTKLVDSASLPKKIDLSATPYSILRALFAGAKKEEAAINQDRITEGLKFMRFLHSKADEGHEIVENRLLFSGVDRYERAMRKTENDYFHYLDDLNKAQHVSVDLPLADRPGKKRVDGLIVKNPHSFLLKEWARRDIGASPLGEGFGLILTNFGNQRYILGVDPEKGVNLRGLGALLNRREAEKRGSSGSPFPLPWYEGNCPFFNYRIIDSPQDGTTLHHQEIVDLLLEFSRIIGSIG